MQSWSALGLPSGIVTTDGPANSIAFAIVPNVCNIRYIDGVYKSTKFVCVEDRFYPGSSMSLMHSKKCTCFSNIWVVR